MKDHCPHWIHDGICEEYLPQPMISRPTLISGTAYACALISVWSLMSPALNSAFAASFVASYPASSLVAAKAIWATFRYGRKIFKCGQGSCIPPPLVVRRHYPYHPITQSIALFRSDLCHSAVGPTSCHRTRAPPRQWGNGTACTTRRLGSRCCRRRRHYSRAGVLGSDET